MATERTLIRGLDAAPQAPRVRRWASAQQRALCHAAAHALLCASLVSALSACETQSPPQASRGPREVTPDRLAEQERPDEAATAFGLSLPRGMRLTSQSSGSASFLGRLELSTVVEHLEPHLKAERVEIKPRYALFQNAKLDGSDKVLRVDISAEGAGTLVSVRDVTPPPAPPGVSEAEMWRRAGRNPDGTPLDQNQLY